LIYFSKGDRRLMKVRRVVGNCLVVLLGFLAFGCHRNTPDSSQNNSKSLAGSDQALIIRPTDSPPNGDSREPDLYATHDGRVILSWVEKIGEKRYALKMAARNASGWSEAHIVAEGENWFVNWADFPSVIALQDRSLAAHWLVKSGKGTYAYDVNIARSKDNGETWSKPIVPHSDQTQTEHGFVSLIPLADGRVGAVWLDGRNMKNVKHESDEQAPSSESMTLRYAAIDAEGKLSDEVQLDDRVCECCQTSAAMTNNGIIAAYRDRSPTEVRDISFVRNAGNGTWSTPQPVHTDNWEINGCPVNGPSIATDGGRVAIAWFTGVGDTPHVKVAFSDDAGATFGVPIQVDDGNTIGRVDALLLSDGSH
jgi:hypothetical protein